MKVYYERLNAEVTPEAFARLREKKIVLESADTSKHKGRYSIIVFDSYGEIMLNEDKLTLNTNDNHLNITEQPYEYLKDFINRFKTSVEDEELGSLPFISGFIGSCSFDLVRHEFPILRKYPLESHPHHDVHFYMVEDAYVFDHYKEYLYIVSTNLFSNEPKEALVSRVKENVKKLKDIEIFKAPVHFSQHEKQIESNIQPQAFLSNVRRLKKLICKGDMFQVVPSIIYRYAHGFNEERMTLSYQLYQNLKRQNPSPYMYYMNFSELIIVGSSPESFVKVEDRMVITNPIAGTIKRGKSHKEDLENEKSLISDEKELSEHRMLVDLGRNDIHRVCKRGTSKMKKLMTIEKYEHVMHIVSEISGELPKDYSPMSVIASLLPTGTVSGAPKLRAIQRIYETEKSKRGIYSGGIGYINCTHDLDFALAIRTMMIDKDYVDVQAGCGVVHDSIPEKELEETRLKAKSLLEVTP
ncbi:anthranilate synthase component I [Staphylococcus sp. SQ8-PEA]|uniref:Anthranilate synthase component 1 n=1 Tax=Staphylococcus marylandisciuri TaxID=2981529 RepID=A0ABT2QNK5_9STAP|nr:anthranilate synthase component I [Staphylococcus marylandisciuri]MCU5745567.1 anthranilate synthase component I [Staphylococcus marylandisciuri]